MSVKSKYKKAKLIHNYMGIGYLELARCYIRKSNINFKINDNGVNFRVQDLLSITKLLKNNWKIVSASKNLITFQSSNDSIITCRADIGFDFGHLCEIFLEKVYGSNFNNKNIIDVGMSNGDSSIYFAKEGAKRVVGIEPDGRSHKLAVENINASKVKDRVTALNRALSDTGGDIQLTVYDKNPNTNSVDQSNMVNLKDTMHKETVKSLRLRNIIEMFDGEQINLLKMDCEGCEYSVLKNLDVDSYKKIENIIMEYHNGLQFLKNVLETNGFAVEVNDDNGKMGYLKAKKIKI